jgi:hypothetical protein
MLKPNLVERKPIIRPYEVITVCKKFLKKYFIVATSADHAVQSVELENGEVIVEARELVDHILVIAK